MARTNPPFMGGVPEFLVLRILAQREMYGYELIRAIQLATDQAIGLKEGVIYPILYSLESRGALRAKPRIVNGRERVYYVMTAKGRRRLDQMTKDWVRVTEGVELALTRFGHA